METKVFRFVRVDSSSVLVIFSVVIAVRSIIMTVNISQVIPDSDATALFLLLKKSRSSKG